MSTMLWTSDAMATAMRAATQGALPDGVTGLSIDSRTIAKGEAYFAIKGDVHDGHAFVEAALKAGAGLAVVEAAQREKFPAEAPLLVVDDVLAGLVELAHASRARLNAKIIAVTGSVGKTSTKDMAAAALSPQGRVHAAEASLNNHWGVPLTLARMPQDTDWAILELGMNHPGEIAPLSRLARPHVAMITTVAAAHLEAFGVIEGIAREKGSIFEGLEPVGHAILPEDLPVTQILRDCADAAGALVMGFGRDGQAKLVQAKTEDGALKCRARIGGETVDFTLQTTGAHFAMNAVGVLAALAAAGADLKEAAKRLGDWLPPAGRGAVEDLAGIRLIDDAYNANPTSLSAGLATLAGLQGGRRVAILGDMLELGSDEIAMHRAMADDPAMALVDLIHSAGPRMRHLHDALPPAKRGIWAETAAELAGRLADLVAPGDIVLVKGSKSSKISTVVDALRKSAQTPASDTKE